MKENTDHKNGCLICGKELIYKDKDEETRCSFCHNVFYSNVKCLDGHYICDRCHSMSSNELIQEHCIHSHETDPLNLALELMKHPSIKMHGPEHHFLVPAVLLAAYYNKTENIRDKKTKVIKARTRAEKILGGFCGTHGACGAAVGTGIFVSLITNCTPLSGKEWRKSNMMTSKSLSVIAEHGGPRCCKRNSFLAIKTASEHFNINSSSKYENFQCEFSDLNKECLKSGCPFFKNTI